MYVDIRYATAKNNLSYNEVYLGEDGLIYIFFRGDQNGESVRKVGEQIKKIKEILQKNARPIIALVNVSQARNVSLSARQMGIRIMKETDCDRAAIFGSQQLFQRLISFMIIASGRGFKVKYFTNEKEAKEWVLNK
jgi:hypothetical protein